MQIIDIKIWSTHVNKKNSENEIKFKKRDFVLIGLYWLQIIRQPFICKQNR